MNIIGREILVPICIVAIIATMLVPLPEALLSFLLVTNFTVAVLLLISSLYITEPLRLSVLPTLLLITTLYRLALNIATTRMILSTGSAGDVVAAFGNVVVQGNLVVGFVVFLIITLVQFIVVAKGAERVAEVSARFALDAMPGKQMSIDADVRAGLIDSDVSKKRRDELQAESRFYGSLDGAMKFVKGDSIAGLVITAINVIGGLAVGIFMQDLELEVALKKFTLLTIGDGLLSQIPALLTATAAGIIVTRVSLNDGGFLAKDLIVQLTGQRKVQLITSGICLLVAVLPGLPAFPFVTLAGVLLLSSSVSRRDMTSNVPITYKPKFVPVIEIVLTKEEFKTILTVDFQNKLEEFRRHAFEQYGLALVRPSFRLTSNVTVSERILIRGIPAKYDQADSAISGNSILTAIEHILKRDKAEFVDDLMTRRLLDLFDREAPELISSVVPGVVTVTQLSTLLRSLLKEDVPIRHFDLILQAIAEHGPKASSERVLLEEVRIGLKRVISRKLSIPNPDRSIAGLDPLVDLLLVKAEKEGKHPDPQELEAVVIDLNKLNAKEIVIVASRSARRFLYEYLEMRGVKVSVVAYEEVSTEINLNMSVYLGTRAEREESIVMELAA